MLKPDLPDFSLETLADWLGIAVVERHRALPDARLAAEVFLALLPRLRENSIRTLAEAEDACRNSPLHQAGQIGMKLPCHRLVPFVWKAIPTGIGRGM